MSQRKKHLPFRGNRGLAGEPVPTVVELKPPPRENRGLTGDPPSDRSGPDRPQDDLIFGNPKAHPADHPGLA
jgi:hypothetical protein